MRALWLLVVLSCAGSASAQFTTGKLALYVDTAGSDDNACTAPGTLACATIQGAVNKVPKSLRHGVLVNVGPGSFGSFAISGFSQDIGYQTASAGLTIDGTLADSTLSSGTATGVSTGVSTGSTSTFGTLTDATQTWTTDDLRGRLLVITDGTGTGQVRAIIGNTATAVTIAGVWTSTVPVAGSTYAIRDSASFITTCGVQPPPAGGTPAAANAAVRVSGNATGSMVMLRGLGVTAACTFGVYHVDAALLALSRMQFATTAGTASRLSYAGPIYIDSIVSKYSGTTGSHITAGGVVGFSTSPSLPGAIVNPSGMAFNGGTIQNSVFINGGTGLNLTNYRGNYLGLSFVNVNSVAVSLATAQNFQGLQISCTANPSATALLVQGLAGSSGGAVVSPDHVVVTGCATVLQAKGPTAFVESMHGVNATGATTGLKVDNGAMVTITSSNTISASGNEISIDNGAVTSTLAGLVSGDCLMRLGTASRLCRN